MPADSRMGLRTLYRWSASAGRDGLAGLLDGRATGRPAAGSSSDPFLAEIERLWLDQRKKKISLCFEMALMKAREQGWECRSYKAAQRHIAQLQKEKPGVAIALRDGAEAFINKVEPFIRRDYSTLDSNDLWNADHHQFDVLVQVGVRTDSSTGEQTPILTRPWLTAVQDVRSRLIVGWLILRRGPQHRRDHRGDAARMPRPRRSSGYAHRQRQGF